MMTYLHICAIASGGFIALVVLACLAMMAYDLLGIAAVKRSIQALPDVAQVDKAAAAQCMDRALRADWRTRLFDLSAPLMMALVIPFVPRSANKLPALFSKWDNNISLNGDSGGVWIPRWHTEYPRYAEPGGIDDGIWIDYHDVIDWEAVKDCPKSSYDDPGYGGDAYYSKGHHPRSRWARYVWVGLRNRATKLALDLGAAVDRPIEVISGGLDLGTSQEGHFLLKCGDIYHFKSSERIQFFGARARIRSYGYKLEIALKSPDQSQRVAVVAIGWRAPPWKGEA